MVRVTNSSDVIRVESSHSGAARCGHPSIRSSANVMPVYAPESIGAAVAVQIRYRRHAQDAMCESSQSMVASTQRSVAQEIHCRLLP